MEQRIQVGTIDRDAGSNDMGSSENGSINQSAPVDAGAGNAVATTTGASSGGAATLLAVSPWAVASWTATVLAVGAVAGWWLGSEPASPDDTTDPPALVDSATSPQPGDNVPVQDDVSEADARQRTPAAETIDTAETEPTTAELSALPKLRVTLPVSTDERPPQPSTQRDPMGGLEAVAESRSDGENDGSSLEEARLVARSRRELRSGHLHRALDFLRQHGSDFPHGELEEERERLLVEALFESGAYSRAASRATTFLARFPESVHGESVRRYAAAALERLRE